MPIHLTFLPGNIPISQHIERLLKKRVLFVACYADMNNFKPFNDYYGYWRGDEMIRLLARIAMEQCDSQRDFLGHVGGDDFVLLRRRPAVLTLAMAKLQQRIDDEQVDDDEEQAGDQQRDRQRVVHRLPVGRQFGRPPRRDPVEHHRTDDDE